MKYPGTLRLKTPCCKPPMPSGLDLFSGLSARKGIPGFGPYYVSFPLQKAFAALFCLITLAISPGPVAADQVTPIACVTDQAVPDAIAAKLDSTLADRHRRRRRNRRKCWDLRRVRNCSSGRQTGLITVPSARPISRRMHLSTAAGRFRSAATPR